MSSLKFPSRQPCDPAPMQLFSLTTGFVFGHETAANAGVAAPSDATAVVRVAIASARRSLEVM